jgi:hypothetical protein
MYINAYCLLATYCEDPKDEMVCYFNATSDNENCDPCRSRFPCLCQWYRPMIARLHVAPSQGSFNALAISETRADFPRSHSVWQLQTIYDAILTVTSTLAAVGNHRRGSLGTTSLKLDGLYCSTQIDITVNGGRVKVAIMLISVSSGVIFDRQRQVVGADDTCPQSYLSPRFLVPTWK